MQSCPSKVPHKEIVLTKGDWVKCWCGRFEFGVGRWFYYYETLISEFVSCYLSNYLTKYLWGSTWETQTAAAVIEHSKQWLSAQLVQSNKIKTSIFSSSHSYATKSNRIPGTLFIWLKFGPGPSCKKNTGARGLHVDCSNIITRSTHLITVVCFGVQLRQKLKCLQLKRLRAEEFELVDVVSKQGVFRFSSYLTEWLCSGEAPWTPCKPLLSSVSTAARVHTHTHTHTLGARRSRQNVSMDFFQIKITSKEERESERACLCLSFLVYVCVCVPFICVGVHMCAYLCLSLIAGISQETTFIWDCVCALSSTWLFMG